MKKYAMKKTTASVKVEVAEFVKIGQSCGKREVDKEENHKNFGYTPNETQEIPTETIDTLKT